MISAKIVADSKNEFGNRITTMVLTYPRIIHSEIMTHRVFSRNAASSRAIPTEKLIQSVVDNPFIPIAFQSKHVGMQGNEYLSGQDEIKARNLWLEARDKAVESAKKLLDSKITKQLANRLIEPFQYYTTIVTATEWENFFALRCPVYGLFSENMPIDFRSKKDLLKYVKQVEAPEFKNDYDNLTDLDWLNLNKGQAEIHMMALAEAMWDAYNESTPKQLKSGEWHIPFGDNIDSTKLYDFIDPNSDLDVSHEMLKKFGLNAAIKIATARCARVSYTVVGEEDKKDNYENDIKLHDRLLASGHMSPFEHCAQAMDEVEMEINHIQHRHGLDRKGNEAIFERGWSGNFKGFTQYRKTIPGECK